MPNRIGRMVVFVSKANEGFRWFVCVVHPIDRKIDTLTNSYFDLFSGRIRLLTPRNKRENPGVLPNRAHSNYVV